MSFKNLQLDKKQVIYFIALLVLSILTVFKSKFSYDSFISTNIPIYDGVIYENQQIRRFESFNGDFSFINRFSQAFYEFKGNYVSAIYNSFITFCFPSFLINDNDVILRSIIAMFCFSSAIFIYFRENIPPLKLFFVIIIIHQLPLFYHPQIGLGSYIPELTCSLLLISGYILMLYFFEKPKLNYYMLGISLMIIPIGIRFNFFAYTFLFFIPILIIYLKKWNVFDKKLKKYTSCIFLISLLICIYYIKYFFPLFYLYYSTIAYNFSNIAGSFSTMIKNLQTYFSWEFFVLIIFINANYNQVTNRNRNLMIAFPFISFFCFIILFLKSENVPHIIAVMSTFIIFFSFFNLSIKKIKLFITNKINFILIILFISMNLSFIINTRKERNSPLYSVQKSTINFLTKKINCKKNIKLSYICFFEGMAEIPINVVLYKKTGKIPNNPVFFYNHDIFYHNSIKCKNSTKCFEYYLDKIKTINYIIINTSLPKKSLLPIAKKINIKMQNYLKNNPKYVICKKIKNSYYGEITFYKLIK